MLQQELSARNKALLFITTPRTMCTIYLLVLVSFMMVSSALKDSHRAAMIDFETGMKQKVVEGDRPRQRRQTSDRGVRGYNETQKQVLVERHNFDRRLRKASDMRLMEWNTKLEQLAQDWADGCNFVHRRTTPGVPTGFSYNGENLFAATHTYDPVFVLRGWHDDEEKDYDYETGGCKNVCGHYTQVVWASSYAVGCGVTYCSTLQNVDFKQGYYVVCNYGPGGNYPGQKPYKLGSGLCTECPDDAPYCVDGLCARQPMISAADDGIVNSWIILCEALSLGFLAVKMI